MAENKQYIVQPQDNGTVNISEEVIAAIVAHAAVEVEGVASLNAHPSNDIIELVGKKTSVKGVKVTILENNSVAIDCNININYGESIVDVSAAVQDAARTALQSLAAIDIASVNVNVCGIVRQ
ncbi:MAG: Asp23/Gls24 family envelope stress response protein [Peptococcaceae bacterium]|jgi:uncharacterized alkaline shock family protein YloU|nr:Asp23/Gls24 family envelope stress response protein [Peptococcaceae bacterium]